MPTDAAAVVKSAAAAPPGDEAGFTLVELLMGTVLMVVGLVGVMSSTIRLHGLQRLDTEIDQAFQACRSNLEELRAVPIAALPGYNNRGFAVPGPDGVTPILRAVPGDADGLPGEIHVTVDQSAAGFVLYKIRTVVTWRGASDRHTVELSTLREGNP
jgi:type II secretory pathway pseudopilin PulG